MYPVNGSRGLDKDDFFMGAACCIPYEISRKTFLGKMVRQERKVLEDIRFFTDNVPLSEETAKSVLDRLEKMSGPVHPKVFGPAIPALVFIIGSHNLSLAFRASVRLIVNTPKNQGFYGFMGEKAKVDFIRVLQRVLFRSIGQWAKIKGKRPDPETRNRLRANVLFLLGTMIDKDERGYQLPDGNGLTRIANLVKEEHPGMINNTIFFIRMAIEKDPRCRDRCVGVFSRIRSMMDHSDEGIAREASELISLLDDVISHSQKEDEPTNGKSHVIEGGRSNTVYISLPG